MSRLVKGQSVRILKSEYVTSGEAKKYFEECLSTFFSDQNVPLARKADIYKEVLQQIDSFYKSTNIVLNVTISNGKVAFSELPPVNQNVVADIEEEGIRSDIMWHLQLVKDKIVRELSEYQNNNWDEQFDNALSMGTFSELWAKISTQYPELANQRLLKYIQHAYVAPILGQSCYNLDDQNVKYYNYANELSRQEVKRMLKEAAEMKRNKPEEAKKKEDKAEALIINMYNAPVIKNSNNVNLAGDHGAAFNMSGGTASGIGGQDNSNTSGSGNFAITKNKLIIPVFLVGGSWLLWTIMGNKTALPGGVVSESNSTSAWSRIRLVGSVIKRFFF